jgi:DNA polymerase
MSRFNGTLIPKVLFVGEAPGRLGADLRRRPFCDDRTEARFDELLASIDLSRDEIFITTSVLCCPADKKQHPRPSIDEVRNCGRFLAEALRLLAPPVVVALGAVALRAVGRLIDRPLVLADTVGTVVECDDFLLVPLYVPNSRVLQTVRPFQQQKSDFAAVREAIAWTTMAAV